MTWPLIDDAELTRFLLVLARCAAFVAVFPPLGGTAVPLRVKAGAAGVLALLLAGGQPLALAAPPQGLQLALMMARETLLGLLLGSLVQFAFMATQFAGQAVGVQMGLAAAALFDPASEETVAVTGRFYYLIGLLVFLGLDLHHPFLRGLADSFRLLPAGGGGLAPATFMHWAELSGKVLVLGLRLSLPVIGALLILDTALAFLSRIVPQMNVFLVGVPLKIGAGLAVLALGMGPAAALLRGAFESLATDFYALMNWVQ